MRNRRTLLLLRKFEPHFVFKYLYEQKKKTLSNKPLLYSLPSVLHGLLHFILLSSIRTSKVGSMDQVLSITRLSQHFSTLKMCEGLNTERLFNISQKYADSAKQGGRGRGLRK